LFLDPPSFSLVVVVSRLVITLLVFSMNVDIVVVVVIDAISMMAVVISAGMAIEYDNMDRVTCNGK